MLEEYGYRMRRRRALGEMFNDVRVGIAVLGAVMLIAMQAVELALLFGGH